MVTETLAQHCATFFVVLPLLQQLFLTKLFIRKKIKNGLARM
jgi:hypothetical protein